MTITIQGLPCVWGTNPPVSAEAEVTYDVTDHRFTASCVIEVPNSWEMEKLTVWSTQDTIEKAIEAVGVMLKTKLVGMRQAYQDQNLPSSWVDKK